MMPIPELPTGGRSSQTNFLENNSTRRVTIQYRFSGATLSRKRPRVRSIVALHLLACAVKHCTHDLQIAQHGDCANDIVALRAVLADHHQSRLHMARESQGIVGL